MTEQTSSLVFSCIEEDPDSVYKYRVNFDLWKHHHFTRLKDARKFINSIKKDLIGKRLKKILFLGDLGKVKYEYGKYEYEGQVYDTPLRVFEDGTSCPVDYLFINNALGPVILCFEDNQLGIVPAENGGRSFDPPNFLKLSYNSIPDIDEIEKTFSGVNNNAKFREIIDQELEEIILERKCTHIEFKFKNGYGCKVYYDTFADSDIQFMVIEPEKYEANYHTLYAYKEQKDNDWKWDFYTSYYTTRQKVIQTFLEDKKKNGNICEYRICPRKLFIENISKRHEILKFLLVHNTCDEWLYIPETKKWHFVEEMIDEPNKIPKICDDFSLVVDINKEGIETHFDWFDEDYPDYKIYYKLKTKTKNQKGKELCFYSPNTREINKLIKDIEAGKKAKYYDIYNPNRSQLVFIYPKPDNKVRFFVRDKMDYLLKGGKFIIDVIIDKKSLIKELKKAVSEVNACQKEVNKRIKEYKKEHTL